MFDVLALSGSQILAMHEPEMLFSKPTLIAERYHQLARRWHPDTGGDHDVFAHINTMHEQAEKLIESGTWRGPGEFAFTADGKTYALKYFKSFEFELGHAYLSRSYVAYLIGKDNIDFAEQARRIIEGLRTPNATIRRDDTKSKAFDTVMKTMDGYLPKLQHYYTTSDGAAVLMIDKPADLIRMRDLRDHCGGSLDGKHVAWMVSRMLHHASYFEYAGLTHNDFSMDTLFVCPEHHTVCVLGGWWYAIPAGEKLKGLPQRTFNVVPGDVVRTKLASLRTDVELTKLTGRELLGDANPLHLTDKDIRPQILNWLRIAAGDSAQQDYNTWRERVLGPRKFTKLLISATDVYPTE